MIFAILAVAFMVRLASWTAILLARKWTGESDKPLARAPRFSMAIDTIMFWGCVVAALVEAI